MNHRFLVSLVIAPIALLHATPPAHALSCVASYVRMISPPAERPAPLNARVLVEVFAMQGQKVELDTVLLRAKGSNLPIKAARKLTGSAEVRVLELSPAAPLRAKTEYEVVSGPAAAPLVAGHFTTGEATDRSAPTLKALTVKFHDQEVSNVWWGPGKRRLRWLVVEAAREDSERELPFALWIGEGKTIDFGKPPTSYVLDYGRPASLGQVPSSCLVTNLALPAPGKAGRLRVGVRVIDAAGNLSSPLEAEVDLRRPEKR